MKKLLVVAIVAASFASCSNGEGDKKVEEVKTGDSAMVAKPDSSSMMSKPDTMAKPDTSKMKMDTTKK